MDKLNLYLGDCLEVMKDIPDKCVNLILCDPPFGTTRNKWDSVIDLDLMWKEYNRIIKDNGAILLFAQTPFDKVLGVSNIKNLKYEWIWRKPQGTGHLNAKKMPLKNHENILVFYASPPPYHPQFREGKPYTCKSGRGSSNYGEQVSVVTVNDGNSTLQRRGFLMKLNELIDALIEVRENYGGDVECAISLNGELTCVSAFVDDLDYVEGEVTLYGETDEL